MKDDLIRRGDAQQVLCDACGNVACPKRLIPRCSYYEQMRSIPAVDAVEVVRCAKCVYSHVIEDSFGEQLVCKKYDRLTLATDYCSDGRREDGDV